MSRWNHPMCQECWDETRGDAVPVRMLDPDPEVCCWCGADTRSGIYVRAHPHRIAEHKEHS